MSRSDPANNRVFGALVRLAHAQDWTVAYTQNSHIKWTAPSGERHYSASTPSDVHSYPNTVRDLERLGMITNGAALRHAEKKAKTQPDTKQETTVADQPAVFGELTEPDEPEEAAVRPMRVIPRKPCAVCGVAISTNRMGPHLRSKHPGVVLPVPSDATTLDRLVAVVFPQGPPMEPDVLVALAQWVEATSEFLVAIGDETEMVPA